MHIKQNINAQKLWQQKEYYTSANASSLRRAIGCFEGFIYVCDGAYSWVVFNFKGVTTTQNSFSSQ